MERHAQVLAASEGLCACVLTCPGVRPPSHLHTADRQPREVEPRPGMTHRHAMAARGQYARPRGTALKGTVVCSTGDSAGGVCPAERCFSDSAGPPWSGFKAGLGQGQESALLTCSGTMPVHGQHLEVTLGLWAGHRQVGADGQWGQGTGNHTVSPWGWRSLCSQAGSRTTPGHSSGLGTVVPTLGGFPHLPETWPGQVGFAELPSEAAVWSGRHSLGCGRTGLKCEGGHLSTSALPHMSTWSLCRCRNVGKRDRTPAAPGLSQRRENHRRNRCGHCTHIPGARPWPGWRPAF